MRAPIVLTVSRTHPVMRARGVLRTYVILWVLRARAYLIADVCQIGDCKQCNHGSALTWIFDYQDRCSPDTPIVVVGNQTDKPQDQWKVSSQEAEAWATRNDSFYIETSAIGLINIDEIFTILIEKMIQQKHLNEPSCSDFAASTEDSYLTGISSRSLLKNSTPYSYGIPEITQKAETRPLPPSQSRIRVGAPPTNKDSKKSKNSKCC